MVDFEAEQCTNVCIKLIIVEVYRNILIWQVKNQLAGKNMSDTCPAGQWKNQMAG